MAYDGFMKRNYLPITVVVLVLGAGLSVIPQTVELSQPDELVTLYNQTTITKPFDGATHEYTFRMGRVDTVDGFSPTLILTNSADVEMNATVVNLDHPDGYTASMDESQSFIVFEIEEAGSYDLEIAGRVYVDEPVEVTAAFIYYRHAPPEHYTYYPYRYFGFGMASVGIVATAIAVYYDKRTAEKLHE
jgi:hypothetical protein